MSNTKEFSACSINVNGIVPNSKWLLQKYSHENKYTILTVQETLTSDLDKLHFTNMNCVPDTNKSKNRGAALYVSHEYSLTKLDKISRVSTELDSAWGLVIISNKRYIIGSIYVKRNCNAAISEVMNLLNEAHKTMIQLKATGIILLGDFNARHVTWGDTKNDSYGIKLVDQLDYARFSICSAKTPTFLSVMGSSCIDFAIVSNNLTEKINGMKTDDEIELFTGAPRMGHIPLILNIAKDGIDVNSTKSNHITSKLDINKINWENWSQQIESELVKNMDSFENEQNPDKLWNDMNNIFLDSTKNHGAIKRTSKHSKPYWSAQLSKLSDDLRTARKRYKQRNTDPNLENLVKAKENFEQQKQLEGKEFILKRTTNLNSAQARHFWKEFNKMFKKKSDNKVEPLTNDDGNLITEGKEISNIMYSTFFEAKHLKSINFNDEFCATINQYYNEAINVTANEQIPTESDITNLNQDITLKEIESTIKQINSSGKSFDNMSFHPTMLKHLGKNAKKYLCRLFNLCMSKRKWAWKSSEVIFLKKSGKDNYNIPGSYRPISITSYVGKLMERILANRIEKYLTNKNLQDPYQEGFSKGKNSIRYLNRLNLSIHADRVQNLTILCLFIDFEKAFDSVWIKGLLYKLAKINICGNILNVIKDFLSQRQLILNINNEKGDPKETTEYGLPQGSVLSPLLFKIFLMDIIDEIKNKPYIDIYKFADDGTVKVTAPDTPTCLKYFQQLLNCISDWKNKWRLKINCQKNKTEVLCFNTSENNESLVPSTFKFDNENISLVEKTKVLGLIIDKDLNYKHHTEETLKILNMTWVDICKYSNRMWGFNIHTMVQLIKTLFIPKLQYAGHIYLTDENIATIIPIWYKLLKMATGAVFNISLSVAEIILGLPPLEIQTKINRIKHYLKLNIMPIPSDLYVQKIHDIYDAYNKTPPILHKSLKEVFHFLNWKMSLYPLEFTDLDKRIISSSDFASFGNLSTKSCSYTPNIIKAYTEKLWGNNLKNKYQNEGYPKAPNPSCLPLPIPKRTSREQEVKLLNIFYKNNITNSFLYSIGKAPTPLCRNCKTEEDTIYHILLSCERTPEADKNKIKSLIPSDQHVDEITTLNLSRNTAFITTVMNIINHHNLPSEINLSANYV